VPAWSRPASRESFIFVVVRGSISLALGAAFSLAALFASVPTQAQESAATYPSRAITFLVGYPWQLCAADNLPQFESSRRIGIENSSSTAAA
jgi:hypothetical protein